MPDAPTHQRKVEHNRRVIAHLQSAGDEYLDWAVIVMFYQLTHQSPRGAVYLESHRRYLPSIHGLPQRQEVLPGILGR